MADEARHAGPATGRLLPPASARTLERVAATSLPVLCLDSFGPAFDRIAAGIHAASRRDRLVQVDLRASRDGLLAGLIRAATSQHCTLSIDGLERLDDDAQGALLRLLDGDGDRPRLVTASLADLEELRASLRPELWALATTITVRAPALARAGTGIADIARARLAALAEELGVAPPGLSPRAVEALAAHDWPGDAAELDAVLARTLVGVETSMLQAADLRWEPLDPTGAAGSTAAGSPPAVATARTGGDPPAGLVGTGVGSEAIALELAHRIKNPLVTVRTFVQSVARLAADPADLARFRDLTEDAIARMDDALEDILAFSRLAPPEPDAIEVVGVLRDEIEQARLSRGGNECRIEVAPGAHLVAIADGARLRAAFASIARHVLETIEPQGTLVLEVRGDALALRLPEAGATSHLRGVTGLDDELPLPLLLASGALASGGASVACREEDGLRLVEIRFPGAEAARSAGQADERPGARDGRRREG